MKKRKKGAIALYSIYVILALATLSAIMINLMNGTQTATRMSQAAEEGAKVRAGGVDILLKEEAGILEIYHNSVGYTDNVTHTKHQNVLGHESVQLPQSTTYQNAKKATDEFAKDATVRYANNAIAKGADGKPLASISRNDICFDFKALPDGSLYDKTFDPDKAPASEKNQTYKLNFSCTTANGDVIKANDVQVSGVKGNTIKVKDENGNLKTVKAANVVFIGIKYQYTYFYAKLLENVGMPTTRTGESWAIAYPQVDKCVRTDSMCKY